jgi:hypothetical protein
MGTLEGCKHYTETKSVEDTSYNETTLEEELYNVKLAFASVPYLLVNIAE